MHFTDLVRSIHLRYRTEFAACSCIALWFVWHARCHHAARSIHQFVSCHHGAHIGFDGFAANVDCQIATTDDQYTQSHILVSAWSNRRNKANSSSVLIDSCQQAVLFHGGHFLAHCSSAPSQSSPTFYAVCDGCYRCLCACDNFMVAKTVCKIQNSLGAWVQAKCKFHKFVTYHL